MSYQVLARKWRPRRFSELVGQTHVVRALTNALDHDRLHHAFLFTGTRGVGKTTLARILAKSLNCERGVGSAPCGECTTCQEVDAGRFVDLIEVDAASRTKVDDTRELLDNVQYAPTRGRYKVYLIDEVHMLSGHSFNALLKTLEEPPPHVKFLLATTDPQRLPVTVLSRCLQFNLKRLDEAQIGGQLETILRAENITYEPSALAPLVRAADGSMRDALSLLDQAIAYGGGALKETEVREMLGSIDQQSIDRLVDALMRNDAPALLALVAEIADYRANYDDVLKELLIRLHRISLAQMAPTALPADERAQLASFAQALSAEDLQLFFQIGSIGRRDLTLAPNPRVGLEMTLLRMLAFKPADAVKEKSSTAGVTSNAAPAAVTPTKPVANVAPSVTDAKAKTNAAAATAAPVAAPATNRSWRDWIESLGLAGIARELAQQSALEPSGENAYVLAVSSAGMHLYNKDRLEQVRQAMVRHLGREIKLEARLGDTAPGATPAEQRIQEQSQRQQQAVAAIQTDPLVRALEDQFNGRADPATIRAK